MTLAVAGKMFSEI